MTRFGAGVLITAGLLLSACGGGGSTGLGPIGFPPAPGPTQSPAVTTAQGTLVDDPSGAPLSGVRVQVDPWIAFATPGPTPTPIASMTTDANGHFTVSEPNGVYLLVIGDDDATYPNNRPTIHDRVVLAGQTTLSAPNLQAIAPAPNYTPPAVETNGDYRLATIDATRELPCIQDWDAQRVSRSLSKPVVDEWLTENVRGALGTASTGGARTLTTADDQIGTTATNQSCTLLVNNTFAAAQYTTVNGQTWFGGAWMNDPTGGYGVRSSFQATSARSPTARTRYGPEFKALRNRVHGRFGSL